MVMMSVVSLDRVRVVLETMDTVFERRVNDVLDEELDTGYDSVRIVLSTAVDGMTLYYTALLHFTSLEDIGDDDSE
jgi:hypothetical protein